jgi:hypothetical protein
VAPWRAIWPTLRTTTTIIMKKKIQEKI